MWQSLDAKTFVLEIAGVGCVIRRANQMTFIPGVRLQKGELVAFNKLAESNPQAIADLPGTALHPGWPTEIWSQTQRYYRATDANQSTGQAATYLRMLGGGKSYDGEFLYIPMANQTRETIQFDRIPFEVLPMDATVPK
jgi:hypothetical protein